MNKLEAANGTKRNVCNSDDMAQTLMDATRSLAVISFHCYPNSATTGMHRSRRAGRLVTTAHLVFLPYASYSKGHAPHPLPVWRAHRSEDVRSTDIVQGLCALLSTSGSVSICGHLCTSPNASHSSPISCVILQTVVAEVTAGECALTVKLHRATAWQSPLLSLLRLDDVVPVLDENRHGAVHAGPSVPPTAWCGVPPEDIALRKGNVGSSFRVY